MSLSKVALNILKNPTRMLHLEHSQKSAIDPKHIYKVKQISSCDMKTYVKALKEIRYYASRRGVDETKTPIQEAIYAYTKDLVYNNKMTFGSLNQLNNHIKGLWGCEIPKKFREEFLAYYRGEYQPEPSTTTVIEEDSTAIEEDSTVSLNIEGLSFKLSKGASLTIGELTTKTLDFKGLKSVSINRVEGGSLYGVSLET